VSPTSLAPAHRRLLSGPGPFSCALPSSATCFYASIAVLATYSMLLNIIRSCCDPPTMPFAFHCKQLSPQPSPVLQPLGCRWRSWFGPYIRASFLCGSFSLLSTRPSFPADLAADVTLLVFSPPLLFRRRPVGLGRQFFVPLGLVAFFGFCGEPPLTGLAGYLFVLWDF